MVIATGQSHDLISLLQTAAGLPVAVPLTWTSSNNAIVTVDSTGRATGVAEGDAVVSASLVGDPSVVASIAISVVANPTVQLITITPPTPTLVIGGMQKLIADVTMADGQINGNVSWSSSDDTIATVNPTTGEVSALRTGKVSILASYLPDPRYKGLADVTVVADSSQVPTTPSPSAVIFGPGATPIPSATTPQQTSTPTSTPTGIDSLPTTAPSAPNSHWTPELSGVSARLWDVYATDTQHAWAVGDSNTILLTTDGGATWQSARTVPSGQNNSYSSVFFVNSSTGWVVGGDGMIAKSTDGGQTWSQENPPQDVPAYDDGLSDVVFVDATHGWAVGEAGVLATTDGGTTWSRNGQAVGKRIAAYDASHLVVAGSGSNDTIIYVSNSGGQSWQRIEQTNVSSADGVYMLSPIEVWCTSSSFQEGYSGTVYHSSDGGLTFSEGGFSEFGAIGLQDPSGPTFVAFNGNSSNTIQRVFFATPQAGWAVGDQGAIFKY